MHVRSPFQVIKHILKFVNCLTVNIRVSTKTCMTGNKRYKNQSLQSYCADHSPVWCWILGYLSPPYAPHRTLSLGCFVSNIEKWLRLPAPRLRSSKYCFTGQDMSPRWKTITYQRSYFLENCLLAITTKGHLGKDRHLENVLWHLQHQSLSVDNTSHQSHELEMHSLLGHQFIWNHTKRQMERVDKPGPL